MREAVYGWMTLHLKGEGDGAPAAEPPVATEDPETLRCYPGESRPDDWMTLPRFAAAEGRRLLASRPGPKDAAGWREVGDGLRTALVEKVFGGFPAPTPISPRSETVEGRPARLVHFQPEPGLELTARVEAGDGKGTPLAILIDLDGAEAAGKGALAAEVRRAGWGLVTLDLRATGKLAWPSDKIGGAPDHNSAEWGLWIGRPLLGQWVLDVRRLLDALERADGAPPTEVILIGNGPGGLVALCAGAVDARVTRVAAIGSLASYLSDQPYIGQRLGIMAPGIVRDVGDVAHIAALNAPRRVVIAGGVGGDGKPLGLEQLRDAYRPASTAWESTESVRGLSLLPSPDPAGVLRALK
jgi:hypothetical protein